MSSGYEGNAFFDSFHTVFMNDFVLFLIIVTSFPSKRVILKNIIIIKKLLTVKIFETKYLVYFFFLYLISM